MLLGGFIAGSELLDLLCFIFGWFVKMLLVIYKCFVLVVLF